MIYNIQTIIQGLHDVDVLWLMGVMFFLASLALIAAERFFGLYGLYVYTIVSLITANIQVMKVTVLFGESIALGTVLFSSTFLCSDIINERYGASAAFQGIAIGFYAYFIFSVFMLVTLGFVPAPESLALHDKMMGLFLPAPIILCASFFVYFVSQSLDIYLFASLRQTTSGRFLWLRTFVSTGVAAFVDNALFSILVWYVFSAVDYSLEYIFWTYVVNVFILRLVITILWTPLIYAFKKNAQKV